MALHLQDKEEQGQVTSKSTVPYLWIALSLIWMAVIFGFSHQANSGAMTEAVLGDANVLIRKSAHVTEYAVLFCLYWQVLKRLSFWSGKTALKLLLTLIMVALYAKSDEWHQSFVPGRSSSDLDVLVDTAGGVIGLVVCLLWQVITKKQSIKNK